MLQKGVMEVRHFTFWLTRRIHSPQMEADLSMNLQTEIFVSH